MSYHGKLQTLKNGTADREIQQWAHNELAVAEINYENAERIIQEQKELTYPITLGEWIEAKFWGWNLRTIHTVDYAIA